MPRERFLSNVTLFIHGDHRRTLDRWSAEERGELFELLLYPPTNETDIPNSRVGDKYLEISEQNKRLYKDE